MQVWVMAARVVSAVAVAAARALLWGRLALAVVQVEVVMVVAAVGLLWEVRSSCVRERR